MWHPKHERLIFVTRIHLYWKEKGGGGGTGESWREIWDHNKSALIRSWYVVGSLISSICNQSYILPPSQTSNVCSNQIGLRAKWRNGSNRNQDIFTLFFGVCRHFWEGLWWWSLGLLEGPRHSFPSSAIIFRQKWPDALLLQLISDLLRWL